MRMTTPGHRIVPMWAVFTLIVTGAASAGPTFPLEITGSDGKVLVLERPPQRIIALDSGAVEILFALGEGGRVVGAHEYLHHRPGRKRIERVGNSFGINFEKVVSLRPDLIFIFFNRFVPELRRLGAPVLYLEPPQTLAGVINRVRLWGKIVDRRSAAETVGGAFEKRLKAIQQALHGVQEGPRVFHDAAPGLWTLGQGSLAQDIYEFLKAENVFQDLHGAHQVSPEAIVARNPQVIISVHAAGPKFFAEHPAFRNLEAVQKGRLFVLDGSLMSVAGPRLVEGIEQLAKMLYPHLFAEP